METLVEKWRDVYSRNGWQPEARRVWITLAELDALAERLRTAEGENLDAVTQLAAAREARDNATEGRRRERKEADREYEALMQQVVRPQGERIKALVAVVRDLMDDEPCRLDHHGYCQEHAWLTEGECPNARGLRLLSAAPAQPLPEVDHA